MSLVEVEGRNAKGRQWIKDHGSLWVSDDNPRPMQCFGNELGHTVRSLDGDAMRNVRVHDDEVFRTIKVDNDE